MSALWEALLDWCWWLSAPSFVFTCAGDSPLRTLLSYTLIGYSPLLKGGDGFYSLPHPQPHLAPHCGYLLNEDMRPQLLWVPRSQNKGHHF